MGNTPPTAVGANVQDEGDDRSTALVEDLRTLTRMGFGNPKLLARKLEVLPQLESVKAEAGPQPSRDDCVNAIPAVLDRAIAKLATEAERKAAASLWHRDTATVGDNLTERRNKIAGGLSIEEETFRKGREPRLVDALAAQVQILERKHQRLERERQHLAEREQERLERERQRQRTVVRVRRTAIGVAMIGLVAGALGVRGLLTDGDEPPAPSPRRPPHGTGITHNAYPYGYTRRGRFAPTFNSYLDQPSRVSDDERLFLGARVISPLPRPAKGFETGEPLRVTPGDRVRISVYIHNDGGEGGNGAGTGPSVARNTRVSVAFPTKKVGRTLRVEAAIYAANAVVDETDLRLRTVYAFRKVISDTGQPIELRYELDSARLLQSNAARGRRGYQIWNLSRRQAGWLFTGRFRRAGPWYNLAPRTGIPVGSTGTYMPGAIVGKSQTSPMAWYGCTRYLGFLQFTARVVARG